MPKLSTYIGYSDKIHTPPMNIIHLNHYSTKSGCVKFDEWIHFTSLLPV